MLTSRGRGVASHGALGCFMVRLIVCPARVVAPARRTNSGHRLGMVISDTLAGYGINESDVRVRK